MIEECVEKIGIYNTRKHLYYKSFRVSVFFEKKFSSAKGSAELNSGQCCAVPDGYPLGELSRNPLQFDFLLIRHQEEYAQYVD